MMSDLSLLSNIEEYISIFSTENNEEIENIRKFALENEVPIIKRSTESLIKFLLSIKKPKNILEVGTAVAYSSLVMASVCDANIISIENNEKRFEEAKKNVRKSEFSDRIELLLEDASESLKNLVTEKKKFDFIFMDAAKAQYIKWLPDIKNLLSEEGILFSDNILQETSLLSSKFLLERRIRTIHKRLKEYIHKLRKDEDFINTLLNVGDGVLISLKKLSKGKVCKEK